MFLDEAHLHADFEPACGWFAHNDPDWAVSSCPPLSERLSWYGAHLYNRGQVKLEPFKTSNGLNTIASLRRLAPLLHHAPQVTLIWDNAPAHRSRTVQQVVEQELGCSWRRCPATALI